MFLGYVNTVVNVTSGTDFVLNLADGFALTAADVGATIMVMAPGPSYAVLWTTLDAVLADNEATLHDAVSADFFSGQAVIYREVAQTASGTRPTLLAETWKFRSSLTTRASADFNIWSIDGSFVPAAGQPVLVTHDVLGDIFGGKIHQTEAIFTPGEGTAIETACQCVSWDVLLTDAILALRSAANSASTQEFQGDGTSTTWNLTYRPVSIISLQECCTSSVTTNGTAVTWVFGYDFTGYAGGQSVTIGGVAYTVFSVTDNQHLILTSSAGVQSSAVTMIGPSNTTGIVNTFNSFSGYTNLVSYAAGCNFQGRSPGDSILIHGVSYVIATFVDYTRVTLTTAPGNQTGVGWIGPAVTFGLVGSGAEYEWSNATSEIVQAANYAPPALNRALFVEYTYVGLSNFYNLTSGQIVQALGSALAPDGVTVTAATGPTVTSLAVDVWSSVDAALSKLCQFVSVGTSIYWYFMDARRGLHFQLWGSTPASWNVSQGDGSAGNVLVQASNTQTIEKMTNAALVNTSDVLGTTSITEDIPCDGTKRTLNTQFPVGQLVSLTFHPGLYVPFSIPFGVLNAGVVTGGMYWTPNSTALLMDISMVALTGGYLVVVYLPIVSSLFHYLNASAIAAQQAIEGGSGEHDVYSNPTGTQPILASGVSLAQILAEYYAPPAQSVKIITYRGGLATGQSITVNLTNIAAAGSYTIDSVQMTSKGNLLMWTCTLIAGAAIGDWRTAFKGMSGASGASLTALGGVSGGGGGGDISVTISGVPVTY